MIIWVVGENYEKRELWGNLLANSLPSSKVITCSNAKRFLNREFTEHDIVFCLTAEFDESVRAIIDQSITSGVPILCVAEDISEITYEKLVQIGIKGVLNSNVASLDTVKAALRIVKGGGIYIESPRKNKNPAPKLVISSSERPSLNMTEWNVFSLTTKGLTVDEIAKQLHITEEDTLSYQTKIIEKTKCKTLPGAVASGLNSGWLMDFK